LPQGEGPVPKVAGRLRDSTFLARGACLARPAGSSLADRVLLGQLRIDADSDVALQGARHRTPRPRLLDGLEESRTFDTRHARPNDERYRRDLETIVYPLDRAPSLRFDALGWFAQSFQVP